MILYEFECRNVLCTVDRFEQRCPTDKIAAKCPACKHKGYRVYSPPTVTVDFRPGWDAGIGAYVDTKKERTRLMEENNLERITV